MSTATTLAVPVEHLRTVLIAHKLRRRTTPPIAPMAAMTAAPALEVDCSSGRTPRSTLLQAAMRMPATPRVQPLQRGWIGRVFNRTQAHGRREVLRTWHTTISTLRREPQYSLHLPLLVKGL
jgi:hypothetical protein